VRPPGTYLSGAAGPSGGPLGRLSKGDRTDVNRDNLWPILSEHGMRPVTQVSIDQVWSALRFRSLKDGEAPFTGGRR
jgi:hypothetical protein